jgi:hypothetical protein
MVEGKFWVVEEGCLGCEWFRPRVAVYSRRRGWSVLRCGCCMAYIVWSGGGACDTGSWRGSMVLEPCVVAVGDLEMGT